MSTTPRISSIAILAGVCTVFGVLFIGMLSIFYCQMMKQQTKEVEGKSDGEGEQNIHCSSRIPLHNISKLRVHQSDLSINRKENIDDEPVIPTTLVKESGTLKKKKRTKPNNNHKSSFGHYDNGEESVETTTIHAYSLPDAISEDIESRGDRRHFKGLNAIHSLNQKQQIDFADQKWKYWVTEPKEDYDDESINEF